MKPEWFMFYGFVLAFIVGDLWAITAELRQIRKLLSPAHKDRKS